MCQKNHTFGLEMLRKNDVASWPQGMHEVLNSLVEIELTSPSVMENGYVKRLDIFQFFRGDSAIFRTGIRDGGFQRPFAIDP